MSDKILNRFECIVCKRDFFDYDVTPNPVIINSSAEYMCSLCFSKFRYEQDYKIKIYLDYYEYYEKGVKVKGTEIIYNGLLSSIYDNNEKLYNGIYEYILFEKNIDRTLISESLNVYKLCKDKLCRTKFGVYPIFFYRISFEKTLEHLNKQICSCCNKFIEAPMYFLKKGKQISLVCRECHDRVYGDGLK